MQDNNTSPHPIDFDTLARGQWITADEITGAVGVGYDHPEFRVKAIAFASLVEHELEARLADGSVIAKLRMNRETSELGIYIMPEQEIPDYTAKRIDKGFGSATTFHRKAICAKTDQLDSEQLRRHQARVVSDSAKLLAAMGAEKKARKELAAAKKQVEASIAELDQA